MKFSFSAVSPTSSRILEKQKNHHVLWTLSAEASLEGCQNHAKFEGLRKPTSTLTSQPKVTLTAIRIPHGQQIRSFVEKDILGVSVDTVLHSIDV